MENVEIILEHQHIHAQDCMDCENEAAKIDFITIQIILQGPLDETQKKRLLQIADHCPVQKTLQSKIQIKSVLIND